ncbi:hypothetical protein [Nocardia terpenica]|uniref:Uncharacterized protein n=1 Tax=Nocardia terpenica TaxID=455432 RepID=A0A164NTU7_9NOCA|nr:hypothetical protein [Nocardia terpenica]KZM74717.1 hypothetical protein AWN90_21915 [Nocardia terpenica]NQE93667.1 hypothetical protein [Nocardia terpenica]
MGGVAVIGEPERVLGYALAGALVLAASDAAAVRKAWDSLDSGTTLVIVTAAAADALAGRATSDAPLTVVMPG